MYIYIYIYIYILGATLSLASEKQISLNEVFTIIWFLGNKDVLGKRPSGNGI